MGTQNETAQEDSHDVGGIRLRKPTATDGVGIWELIAECPPLDRNSIYCNLLQCTDFADTCIVAERDGEALGWISAYRPPEECSTLFVWQVAVHEKARGYGLAGRMLQGLMKRPACAGVSYLKTTITPDNEGSHALFRSFAERCDAPLAESTGFEKQTHFGGLHDSERLITIGPIPDPVSQGNASLSAA
jgi:L-2,4-diaminobutyric acid acetyltransferase